MNVDDQGNDLPIDLGIGNVLKDISAAMPPSASVEKALASSSASAEKVPAEKVAADKPSIVAAKAPYDQDAAVDKFMKTFDVGKVPLTPHSFERIVKFLWNLCLGGIPVSCVGGDTGPVGSTNKAHVSSSKITHPSLKHDVDSEEEDENEHYVPMPDFGRYIPAENPEYSMEYAQTLLHSIDYDDFTADVSVDYFDRAHDDKIRIGPAQIQVYSHVYSLAKRLIKAYPDMYSKLRHGSFLAARQLGMQVDFARAYLRTVTEAYLGSIALAVAPSLDISLLKSEIEKKEQAIAALQQEVRELQRQLDIAQTGPTSNMRQRHLLVHSQFLNKNVGLDLP
ncbi:hypothetical protein COLO4_36192 [Corchorus olitorius]|uniref:Uncharacterized protein n=1 Tax=Corchorus olitorius TaxID=93759 RepID=A0A1R3GAU3_9ROSI|nr:hypothetical protein COLO4_36192 [Corchorus olitorius]